MQEAVIKVYLRETQCLNTTEFHSVKCKSTIIIVILESVLIQKYYLPFVISKTLESDLNGKVQTPAISYDDADVQVNQITVTFAAIESSTYKLV